MSIDEVFGPVFKSDVQTSGAKLFAQDKVSISSGSDTGIHAYIRVSPPLKVRFQTSGIESETFTADCNCPAGKKGRLCKHVWATLLGVQEKHPDFLSSKDSIEMGTPGPMRQERVPEVSSAQMARAAEAAQRKEAYAASSKIRATEYRKQQYQKAKARVRDKKRGGREVIEPPTLMSLPPEVEAACRYFADNGFPMAPLPDEEIANEAKKKLSRVFHPDKGGSHEEIVELNRNWELVTDYLRG